MTDVQYNVLSFFFFIQSTIYRNVFSCEVVLWYTADL